MGCTTAKENKGRVKSAAQLEYELSNCLEHFHSISLVLQSSQKFISNYIGLDVSEKEYAKYYTQIQEKHNDLDHKLIQQFEIFFHSVDQGSKMLPILLEKCEMFEKYLPQKKENVRQFKEEISNHIKFCKIVTLPQQGSSQSTEP